MSADLILPHEGRWSADVEADMDSPPGEGEAVTLRLLGRDYKGVVVAAGDIGDGRTRVRVVGGSGGLDRVLDPKHYRQQPAVGLLWQDLLQETGESLSDLSDTGLLSGSLSKWTRTRGQALDLVSELAGKVGAVWRVQADGRLWIGTDRWEPVSGDWTLIGGSLEAGRVLVAAEVLTADPGQELDGLRLRSIRHVVRAGSSRSILILDSAQTPHPLYRLVDRWMRRRGYDYARPQAGKAVSQDADGTLQVQPDDDSYPPMTGVPYRAGLPGTAIKIAPGARVLVEWEGGDPGAPVVTAWGDSTAQEISIGTGARKVAREQDTVDAGVLTGTVLVAGVPVPVQFTYVPPGAAPQAASPTAALAGKITSGSSILRAGG